MIFHTDPQGSEGWLRARAGVITASRFKDCRDFCQPTAAEKKEGLTRGKPGAKRLAYAAQVAVAVTGVAGPGGGSPAKPVGTVWLAWATPAGVVTELQHFAGDRAQVRAATVQHALARLVNLLQAKNI